ncbi:MAG: subclass B3 metallo-beta-lactamase [Alphaproteobacteria bacterium]|nr:subclass B3 metallo-beta-lactamase [Alphaproteobacteria bacterium]MBU1514390.1 subclass B3 metallo-beta-lactamase [Alphaproteobacteria bacterium]MBU2096034.1 subclass B3 metallo-beta-lactamase [Alphaproteobacteria bacterium]MBU2150076.1 subclass B3 metallo-beta-lactamase [Alphaproteobacteria bacterium]MBU2308589.1 subclass B3 metallo-beta-lactamase [Alphaproteobacteria bacterium]
MTSPVSGLLSAAVLGAAAFISPALAAEAPDAAFPPFKMGEGLYYVGSADYAAYLLTSKTGLIVLDGGDAETGKQVVANIKTLGFDPAQVKILLNTHQHFDHAAGLATIKRAAPGAKLYASAADGPIIAAGGRGDPFLKGARFEYEAVKPDVILKDGQKVAFGGWTLTAHVTGGHTKGCTTWTFPVTVAGKVRQAQVHCSSSVLPGYKLGKTETYPGQTADYEKSFATWKSLPCDVFLASHASFYGLQAKKKALDAGQADAFVDPAGCKAFYVKQEAAFRAELKRQNP